MRGIFTSDFHMFSQRSRIDAVMPQLHEAARDAQLVVLGGDIVDFKWSQLADQEATELAAMEWLDHFLARYPGKQLVYLAGNHDCAPTYLERLRNLAATEERFSVYEYWYQHGDAIFLHGDVVHGSATQAALEQRRSRWSDHSRQGALANSLYNMVFRLRLPALANLLFNQARQVCPRLISYLGDIQRIPGQGIRRVFFGHTHNLLKDFEFDGLVFYNSGAPLKTLPCAVLRFSIQGDTIDGR